MDSFTATVLTISLVLNVVLFIALVWQREHNDRLLDRIEQSYPLAGIDLDWWSED